jgi:hypothetical protein
MMVNEITASIIHQKGTPMIAHLIRIATLFLLPLVLSNACAVLPWDECKAPLRAVLAEFPQYGNVFIAPEFNPKYFGCVLGYTTTDSPEQVLAYFVEQFEEHGWSGVPLFSDGEDEILVHRDNIAYGVRIFDGQGTIVNEQPLPAGTNYIQVGLVDISAATIENYEPNADFPRIELSEQELNKFTGEFTVAGKVEAVITLVDGELQLRRPGRLANSLIPVTPTRFRIKDFSDAFSVEFRVEDGKVENMVIEQNYTHFHHIMGGSMHLRLELLSLQ